MTSHEEFDRRLSSYLDKLAQDKAEVDDARKTELERRSEFQDAFNLLRSSRIRPALDKIADEFSRRGLGCEVITREEPTPWVELNLPPEVRRRGRLIFEADPNTRTIKVSRHFEYLGPGEQVGEYRLDQVTREVIERHVRDFLDAIMSG